MRALVSRDVPVLATADSADSSHLTYMTVSDSSADWQKADSFHVLLW